MRISCAIRQHGGARVNKGTQRRYVWRERGLAVGGVGGVWPRAGRLTSHPWRSHPTRPEATDNGQICARTSPQSLMSHPNLIWTHQMGNCTSCPQNGELAPDGGAGRPSPLTPSLKTPTNRLTVSPQFTTDMNVESRILKESV